MQDKNNSTYNLSEADLMILESYKAIVDSLGSILGDTCEVVLHSLNDLNSSVIYLHNGGKTGRKIGSPMTDKGLKLLEECEKKGVSTTGCYFTQNANGHVMKSSSSIIRNFDKKPIGMLCINFDISAPISDFVSIFSYQKDKQIIETEHFASDIDDLLQTTVNKVKDEIMRDENISSRQKTKEIIKQLNNQGFFKLRNAVPQIAKILEISRDVIYLHLRNQK